MTGVHVLTHPPWSLIQVNTQPVAGRGLQAEQRWGVVHQLETAHLQQQKPMSSALEAGHHGRTAAAGGVSPDAAPGPADADHLHVFPSPMFNLITFKDPAPNAVTF